MIKPCRRLNSGRALNFIGMIIYRMHSDFWMELLDFTGYSVISDEPIS
jgi:hypothetical protein